MEIVYSIVGFIIAIGILAIVHESGHFYAARLCKVRVIRFSIGFGPSRRVWYDKLGTEYVISAIPLGGYVQLLDLNDSQEIINSSDRYMAINSKSPWVRIIILLAGPLFNILFATLIYCLVFILGTSSPLPIIGNVLKGTIADAANLKSGSEIVQINDNNVHDWESIFVNLIKNLIISNNFIKLKVYDKNISKSSIHILNLNNQNMASFIRGDMFNYLGIEPLSISESKILKVLPNSPAFKAKIKPGDIIVSVDNLPVINSLEISKNLFNKIGKQVNLDVNRNGEILSFTVIPVGKTSNSEEKRGVIGVNYQPKLYPPELIKENRYGIKEAFHRAIQKTYSYTFLAGYCLYSMTTGNFYLKNISGPIAIGNYAGKNIKNGIKYFFNFLGLLSINFGVINLLPIPLLDGGSIIYCIYELIIGKPAPLRIIIWGRNMGLYFLVSLLIMVFINDIIQFL